MKVARIAVLIVALGAAVAAGFMAVNLVQQPQEVAETPETAPQIQTTEVLVASTRIPLGGTINQESMEWKVWPSDAVSGSFITREENPDALEEYTEAIATTPFDSGEPLKRRDLARSGRGFMSAILPKGKRAVSVKVESEARAGGFILPNDRIDVILTRSLQSRRGGSDVHVSNTILRNIRVLAIDQVFEEKNGEKFITGEIATLELTPRQAEVVALADQIGDLSLVLRSIADLKEATDADNEEARRLLSGARQGGVQMIKFGVASGSVN